MRTRGDDGFTILELMAVILVIGVLVSIAMASYVPATSSAAAASCRQNQQVLERAIAVYSAEHNGAPVTDLDTIEPYVRSFAKASVCAADDTPFVYDAATGSVSCPNHP